MSDGKVVHIQGDNQMRFVTKRDSILPVLRHAVKFTTSKNLNTVIQYLYIEALDNNVIIIKATDYQISFLSGFAGEVFVPGATTVNAKRFLDIISKFPEGEDIEFSFKASQLHIKRGKSKFQMATLDVGIFPTIPDVKADYSFKVSGELLLNMFKQTYFCISTDATKPIEYSGVHMSVYTDKIELVATDQKRVALTSSKLDSFAEEFIVNVPRRTVENVLQIFDKADMIEVCTDKRHIVFRSEQTEITAKLIEKYSQKIATIFQGNFAFNAKIPRSGLYEVVDRVSAITNPENSAGEVSYDVLLSFSGTVLNVSSIENEIGRGDDSIDNIEYDGEIMNILFNSHFILDVLRNISTDWVEFKINSNVMPVVILPYGNDPVKFKKGEAKYLITPRKQINTFNEA